MLVLSVFVFKGVDWSRGKTLLMRKRNRRKKSRRGGAVGFGVGGLLSLLVLVLVLLFSR